MKKTKPNAFSFFFFSILFGMIVGIPFGFVMKNIGVGVFLFSLISFLSIMGRYAQLERDLYPRVAWICSKKIELRKVLTWNMWLYPVVIATLVLIYLFTYFVLGGDPSSNPVFLIDKETVEWGF